MKLRSSLKNDVINGFSYSFSCALLAKLKKLEKADRVFKDGLEKAKSLDDETFPRDHQLTSIANLVLCHLDQQICLNNEPYWFSCGIEKFKEFVAPVEEFLAIFKK